MAQRRRPIWIAVAAVVALAVAVGAGWMAWRAGPGAVDSATGCPRGRAPAVHVLALVDVAGAYDLRERRRAAAALRSARDGLAPGDRLTVLAPTDAAPATPTVLFSRCLPSPGDAGAARTFADAFAGATQQAAAGRTDATAPLTETLRALAARPEAKTPAQRRVIVLVSDMMENRPGVFSLFAAGATYETFRASEAGLRPPTNLSGIAVHVTQLERDDRMARQREARELFWRPYFEEAGAGEVTWTP